MDLKKVLYRLFVFLQLILAIYFSYQAIQGWNEAPIVVSSKYFVRISTIKSKSNGFIHLKIVAF